MQIKDFKVGQTVWVELAGNASREKHRDELIEEWEITAVGKKYIHAKKKGDGCPVRFEKREYGYSERFIGKTDSCVNYILYSTRKELEEYKARHNKLPMAFRRFRDEMLEILEKDEFEKDE